MPRVASTEISPKRPFVNEKWRAEACLATGITGLAIAAIALPWESTKILGLTVFAQVSCVVVANLIGARDCIQFYTVNRTYYREKQADLENRLFNTWNPNFNAIASVLNYWNLCVISGLVLAFLARFPMPVLDPKFKIEAVQLAPCVAIGSTITLLGSHVWSRRAQKIAASLGGRHFETNWKACCAREGALAFLMGAKIGSISTLLIIARTGLFTYLLNRSFGLSCP